MRVAFRDEHRFHQGSTAVDLNASPTEVRIATPDGEIVRSLQWDRAVDESGRLRRCIACGCRELFVRKDFPQRLGLGLVIVAALVSVILFATGHVAASWIVLGSAVVIDSLIYFMTPRCVVCYRCRTEYRGLEIAPEIEPWDLAVGEKYRPVRQHASDASDASDASTGAHGSHSS